MLVCQKATCRIITTVFGADSDMCLETTHFSASSWGLEGFSGGSGFPDSLVGKEFTCKAGDSGSIPGSGRSPGEGIGYTLQYSCLEAHAVTKMVGHD